MKTIMIRVTLWSFLIATACTKETALRIPNASNQGASAVKEGPSGATGAQGVQGIAGVSGTNWKVISGTPQQNLPKLQGANVGDKVLDSLTGKIYEYTKDSAGVVSWSSTPAATLRGAALLPCSGNPSDPACSDIVVGSIDGDLILNILTGDLFKRVSGAFGSAIGNIRGPAASGGTTIIKWGNTTLPEGLPAGSSVLYKGFAHGSHYGHNQREVECVAEMKEIADRVAFHSGASPYQDVIYPVSTGDPQHIPNTYPAYKAITCSAIHIPSPAVSIRGRSSCPSGWSKIYGGFMMGGYHYYNSGHVTNSICLASDFDTRFAEPPSHASRVYGTQTHHAPDAGQENSKWVACVACYKSAN